MKKKFIVLLALAIFCLSACGKEMGQTNESVDNTPTKQPVVAATETPDSSVDYYIDDIADTLEFFGGGSIETELSNEDEDQWVVAYKLKTDGAAGYPCYLLQARVGAIVESIFIERTWVAAELEKEHITLDGGREFDLEPIGISTEGVSNYILFLTDSGGDLSEVKVDWDLKGAGTHISWSASDQTRQPVDVTISGFDTWQSHAFPVGSAPNKVSGKWFYIHEYVYTNKIGSGGRLYAFPVTAFGDFTVEQLADWLNDRLVFALQDTQTNYEYNYDIINLECEASAYGQKDFGFEWSKLESMSITESGYPLDSFIYIKYNRDDFPGGIMFHGFELDNGDVIFVSFEDARAMYIKPRY